MTLTIHEFTPADKPEWDAFVTACPDATFFHRAGWKDVIEQSFGHKTHFVYAKCEGEIQGVLPLTHINSRLFGNALISNAFCVGGGPASINTAAREKLIDYASNLLPVTGADFLEMRNATVERNGWIEKSDLYATFERTIEADEDANLKQIPRKQRAVVRKALKSDDLSADIEGHIDAFYKLYSLSVRNLGTPVYGKKLFANLKKEFGETCEVLTVRSNSQALCSVMSFYFRDTVLPYYTGGTFEARKKGANDYMYWQVMRRAAARGITNFDFGRSKKGTGPYSFKKNWGFDPRPIVHSFLLKPGSEMPNVNPLNPKYKLFINMWQRLPLPLANAIGPHIVRNIG